ncbi:MAG: hypothetical protein R2880_03095 [Deinococcales bacterium]
MSQFGFLNPSDSDCQQLERWWLKPLLPSLQSPTSQQPHFNGAQPEMDGAASLDPSSSWVLSEQARTVLSSGSPTEALRIAEQASNLVPQDIESSIIYGSFLRSSPF